MTSINNASNVSSARRLRIPSSNHTQQLGCFWPLWTWDDVAPAIKSSCVARRKFGDLTRRCVYLAICIHVCSKWRRQGHETGSGEENAGNGFVRRRIWWNVSRSGGEQNSWKSFLSVLWRVSAMIDCLGRLSCVCLYLYMPLWVCVYMLACLYVCVYTCTRVSAYMYDFVRESVEIYIICMCACVCIIYGSLYSALLSSAVPKRGNT